MIQEKLIIYHSFPHLFKIFSLDGVCISEFVEGRKGVYEFITCDNEGNIILNDVFDEDSIRIHSSTGKFIRKVSLKLEIDKEYDLLQDGDGCSPPAAAVDADGHLWVADSRNNRILQFD